MEESLLELSVKACLPVISVATTDLVNFPEVVQHLTEKAPVAFNPQNKVTKGALYWMRGSSDVPSSAYEKFYGALAEGEASLLVVNPKKPSDVFFDAGVVPVPRDMVKKFLTAALEDEALVASLMPVLGGLTLKDVAEVVRMSMARDGELTALSVMKTRRSCFANLRGMQQIDLDQVSYAPPAYLESWVKREKDFFLSESDNRLRARGLLMDGQPGTGKCLDPDEPVLMFDGTIKRNGDLVAGDRLMGPDSTPRTVLSTNPGHGAMFEVRPTKGRSWRCNGEHILSLRCCRGPDAGAIVFVTVNEWLTWSGYRKASYKIWRAAVDFPERQAPVLDPYFVGLVLGDGTVNEGVSVTTVDSEIVAYLTDLATRNGLVCKERRYSDRTPSYALTTENIGGSYKGVGLNGLYSRLRNYGLEIPCAQKSVPDDFKLGSAETRRQVLAGLLDTDGSYDRDNKVYDFVSKSRRLSEDVAFIARSLGLAAYVTEAKKTCTNTGAVGDYWRVCLSGNLNQIPCRVGRKRAEPRLSLKNVTNVGFEVFAVGEGPWFGITLDGDHQYLLADFTVTHNTEGAKYIAKEWGVPLFRVDFGATKEKWVGNSEANLLATLNRLDREAPCVALFDEIEKVFQSNQSDSSGVTTSMMSQLLWWMAEHTSQVFVVATTNSRKKLPPELYREGRIDEVMEFTGFTDLANAEEFASFVLSSFESVPESTAKIVEDKLKAAVKRTQQDGPLAHGAVKTLVIESIKEAKVKGK